MHCDALEGISEISDITAGGLEDAGKAWTLVVACVELACLLLTARMSSGCTVLGEGTGMACSVCGGVLSPNVPGVSIVNE